MDFASAPLEALLVQNAGVDQLEVYLKQLDRRFRETAQDEKDRFGALQILLPTLKAFVLRRSSHAERENALHTYLHPLIMHSFRHGSMVATESVSLISDTVAYWMARSMEGHDDDDDMDTFDSTSDNFGKSILMLFLGQLLLVMENEPDFVDLNPVQFTQSCLMMNQSDEWKQLESYVATIRSESMAKDEEDDATSVISDSTMLSTKGTTTFDLECCLDVLSRFVLEISDKDNGDMAGWMNVLMAIAVAMMPCTDGPIRSKLTRELIPNAYRWHQQQSMDAVTLENREHWAKMLWKRTLQIFELPATNLLRSETYGLIARFFELFFVSDGQHPVVYLDLRYEEDFFKVLQSGLRSNDSLYRKYSAYLLKRIIDFTVKHPELTSNKPWTRYFEWSIAKSEFYADQWADWFLLYEIMHETVIHLVEPVLPRFEMMLTNAETTMDPSWWILLFYRGFQNETYSVKKGILEYIFTLENQNVLRLLASQYDFMFGAMLKTVDVMSMYTVPTQGVLISPFGEKLKSFIRNLISAVDDTDEKVRLLSQLLHYMSHVLASYIPILYIMEAIVETDGVPAWGPEELKSVRHLVDRHPHFQLMKSKLYLRKLAIKAVIRFANTSKLSFSDVAKTVSSLITDFPIQSGSDAFLSIQGWLEEAVSADKSLDPLLRQLEERANGYINRTASDEEDVPFGLLRNQANVLSRMSIFLITDKDGKPQKDSASRLFSLLVSKLSDNALSITMFDRLLILLDAIWEVFDVCFDSCQDFLAIIGLNNVPDLLSRIDSQYLSEDEDNAYDDDLVDLLVSITRRILVTDVTLEKDVREKLIIGSFEQCTKLLQKKISPPAANKELAKAGYMRLINVLFDAAFAHSLFVLDCDDKIATLLNDVQLRKTAEAVQISGRTWGDTISGFIRDKWQAIEALVHYAKKAKENNDSISILNPEPLFETAVEQLECGSEICAAALMNCVAEILTLPWDKSYDLVDQSVNHAIELIKENLYQSKTGPPMIRAIIRMVFQPELLRRPDLNEDDGPIKRALNYMLEIGDIKPFVVAQCASQLYEFWSTHSPEANQSMLQYARDIARLLVFGPMRERDDQKLEAVVAHKYEEPETIQEAQDSAAMLFTQNDYMVRVYMNDLILRLDKDNDKHAVLAKEIMDYLLEEMNNENFKAFQFLSTIEHRTKLRIWCSFMLLQRFVTEETVDHFIHRVAETMKGETQISVRCYMEWFMARLYLAFPSRLDHLYSLLDNADTAPHHTVSILTVTFTLGEKLDDEYAKQYFEEIFARIIPWLTSNNFTVRLYAYCAWFRSLKPCRERGLNPGFDKNQYMRTLIKFMDTYPETAKFKEKFESHFYMTVFDPIKDYNIEFIFRQLMTTFKVIENEKIASRAFIKINPKPVEECPFTNPSRRDIYTYTDPTELIEETPSDSNKQDMPSDDAPYQKKIMPWDMMMETDVDLSKAIIQKKRRRNDLIVVASLVDRVPNLAGLCRTCEIFNASELVVPNIKVKDDPYFVNISVASERWMPMKEVSEADVPEFLEEKKKQGYHLCGLEQTTTSTMLGEFEFPERCVLLLGKERQGIPANLLQMLDSTVEIPQQGITRSLNVHVSGAICIYEYTKQMQWRHR